MSIFPKIQGPCPYKGALADIMEGDLCRLCQRRVVDLDPFTDAERIAFLAACKGEVCVSYRLRPALAAVAAAAALGAPLVAAAQDTELDYEVILVGAILEPAAVEYITTDQALPDLDIIYADDDEPAQDASQPPSDAVALAQGREDDR